MSDLDTLGEVRRVARAARPAPCTSWKVWRACLWALGHPARPPELGEGDVDAALLALEQLVTDDEEVRQVGAVIAQAIATRYAA